MLGNTVRLPQTLTIFQTHWWRKYLQPKFEINHGNFNNGSFRNFGESPSRHRHILFRLPSGLQFFSNFSINVVISQFYFILWFDFDFAAPTCQPPELLLFSVARKFFLKHTDILPKRNEKNEKKTPKKRLKNGFSGSNFSNFDPPNFFYYIFMH